MKHVAAIDLTTIHNCLGLEYHCNKSIIALVDSEAQRLYAAVTTLMPKIALPLPFGEVKAKLLGPAFLIE